MIKIRWMLQDTSGDAVQAFGSGEVATKLGCFEVTPWGVAKAAAYVTCYPLLSALRPDLDWLNSCWWSSWTLDSYAKYDPTPEQETFIDLTLEVLLGVPNFMLDKNVIG